MELTISDWIVFYYNLFLDFEKARITIENPLHHLEEWESYSDNENHLFAKTPNAFVAYATEYDHFEYDICHKETFTCPNKRDVIALIPPTFRTSTNHQYIDPPYSMKLVSDLRKTDIFFKDVLQEINDIPLLPPGTISKKLFPLGGSEYQKTLLSFSSLSLSSL